MTQEQISQLTDSFLTRMRLPEEVIADPAEREIMADIILAGAEFIDSHAGGTVDYNRDRLCRELLCNYCFYARSDCTEKFGDAYIKELTRLRLKVMAGTVIMIEEDENAQA